jgi:serine/threonine-protein kinase
MELFKDLSQWESPKVGKTKPQTPHSSKSALGAMTPLDKGEAGKMIKEAIRISADSGRLMEAADLLEEAINAAPELRQRYNYQISLWRRGIIM